MKFPELYNQWVNHDLKNHRLDFYKNLKMEDQLKVWEFIEDNYLIKNKTFIKIWFDWGSSGIWDLPFPSSVGVGPCICDYDYLSLSENTIQQLKEWHNYIDDNAKPWVKNDPFDWNKSNEWGLEVAKAVKKDLPNDFYVEYNNFKELIVKDGEIIELDIPDFIKLMNRK